MVTYIDGQKASGSFDKASQVNMNDGRTVEDAITNPKNRIGTAINLLNIVPRDTKYTFTSDGYINAWINQNAIASIEVYGSNDAKALTLGSSTASPHTINNAVFVRKGMKALVPSTNSGSYGFYFLPII